MRRLAVFIFALAFALPLAARTHKMFPATSGSVSRENEVADGLGYERYDDVAALPIAVEIGELVPIPVTVAPKLPAFRRYIRPEAADFMLLLDADFHATTGKYLIVDSAVRPADVQKTLRRHNRNAAPVDGARASSHERGTTFDLAKKTFNGRDYSRMTPGEYKWLLWRLMYYRELGRILVIEERGCLHIFVGEHDGIRQLSERGFERQRQDTEVACHIE